MFQLVSKSCLLAAVKPTVATVIKKLLRNHDNVAVEAFAG